MQTAISDDLPCKCFTSLCWTQLVFFAWQSSLFVFYFIDKSCHVEKDISIWTKYFIWQLFSCWWSIVVYIFIVNLYFPLLSVCLIKYCKLRKLYSHSHFFSGNALASAQTNFRLCHKFSKYWIQRHSMGRSFSSTASQIQDELCQSLEALAAWHWYQKLDLLPWIYPKSFESQFF